MTGCPVDRDTVAVRRRLGLPDLGDGVGLRDNHFPYLMQTPPRDWGVDWFEIISENFLDNHGYHASHNLAKTARWDRRDRNSEIKA
jgi:Protein of unknown function (DUF692)